MSAKRSRNYYFHRTWFGRWHVALLIADLVVPPTITIDLDDFTDDEPAALATDADGGGGSE